MKYTFLLSQSKQVNTLRAEQCPARTFVWTAAR